MGVMMKENITENKFYKVTQTEVYKIIVAIVLCVLPFTFCSMRLGWVFIDGVLFAGFCLTINILMALNAVYYLLLVYLKNKIICVKGEKVYFNLTIVHFAFAVFYLVVNIANLFYDFKQIGVYAYYFGQLLPYVIPTALCMICLLLVPKIKQGLRAVVAVSIITIVGFSSLLVAFEVKKFDFTATPAVLELGNDTYAVVFVTTHDSAGYLEYKNGDEFVRVYDNVAGGKVSNDNIHSIIVKKDKLINNEYRVGASRVLDHLGNSASLGKSIISDTINFKGAPTGDVNLAMLADVHGEVSPAVKALETFDNSADNKLMIKH